jgi:Flp pilus assembly pilin Flp
MSATSRWRHLHGASGALRGLVARRLRINQGTDERGAATAEYAVATMAAVGFAGLLVIILRGEEVRGILTELVRNALTVG